jgi:hypothetical protein
MASATNYPINGKGIVIHVGWKLDTSARVLIDKFPDDTLIKDPIVAVMYKADQNTMRVWYNRRAKKT